MHVSAAALNCSNPVEPLEAGVAALHELPQARLAKELSSRVQPKLLAYRIKSKCKGCFFQATKFWNGLLYYNKWSIQCIWYQKFELLISSITAGKSLNSKSSCFFICKMWIFYLSFTISSRFQIFSFNLIKTELKEAKRIKELYQLK